MLLSDLTENQQPFLDSILKEDADVFGMYCWAIKNDKKLVEDWEMIREEYKEVTGINLTEKQLHEVNWKKLAATAAMIGTLLTPGMAQAYQDGDLRRMGFDDTEVAQLADMPAQDKADTINAQIAKIGGGKSGGGGYWYDFPTVDATTVVDPKEVKPNIRKGVDPNDPDGRFNRPITNKWGQDAGGNAQGTGDPETLQKNTELLRTVINADHRVAGKIKQIYYSDQANKIVIIPNYKDFARMGTNKIDSKLGGSIVDSIAHALIVPIVRTAIHNLGVPNLDMNNVIIVDRGARAPR
jgi:hypothetical protein